LRFKKPHVALLSRDYHELRSNDEIRRLLAATAREDEPVAVFYARDLHGHARGKAGGTRMARRGFERRLITVQRSFDGPTKSDHVRAVRAHLDPLLPVLRGGAFGTLGG
jgi:hypothetical protein